MEAVLETDADATTAPAPWDQELAERYVRGMVSNSNQIQTVLKMLGLDEQDVVAEGIAAAFEDWGEFDPAIAKPQTFITQRANSGVYNFLRRSGAQFRTEQRRMGTLHKADKQQELCEWLKDVFEAAKHTYVEKQFRERRTYPMPITVAIAALMQREALTCRGCARLLAQRDDLRAVLRLKAIPHYSTLSRAAIHMKELTGFHAATKQVENEGSDATETPPT